VGNGVGDGVTTGPLINAAATKYSSISRLRPTRVLRVLVGGRPHALQQFSLNRRCWISTWLLLAREEETFEPLTPPVSVTNDVVRRTNDTEFGLAAYFYADGRVVQSG
jgi:succinate-semialdehyde dehydrogenase/glutarate-semialdehyde dehydrogenase